jgi:hypothetical protein
MFKEGNITRIQQKKVIGKIGRKQIRKSEREKKTCQRALT